MRTQFIFSLSLAVVAALAACGSTVLVSTASGGSSSGGKGGAGGNGVGNSGGKGGTGEPNITVGTVTGGGASVTIVDGGLDCGVMPWDQVISCCNEAVCKGYCVITAKDPSPHCICGTVQGGCPDGIVCCPAALDPPGGCGKSCAGFPPP